MQTYAAAMADRPEPFTQLDRYFAAARIAHEYVGDIFQELVRLDRADAHAPELLAESAAIALRDIHELTRDARVLERQWHEQELLDPRTAARTLHAFDAELLRVLPQLADLRARQDEVARAMRRLLDQPEDS